MTKPSGSGLAAVAKDALAVEQRPKPMRILILGGTAFLGIHMTEIAMRRGHTVTLFNRGHSKRGLFPGIEKLTGDRDGQLDALKGRDWDAVIDNCGYVPRHVRMSAELLAPKVRQYLFISTISVYADFSKENDEASPVAKMQDETCEDRSKAYGALKALCEKAAAAAMPDRTTIVRPGLIVGPEDPTDRFTYWPVRAARGGEMLAPGDPRVSYQLIDVRDLARFCIDAVETGSLGVFNVTSPASMFTIGDIVRESVAAAHALANSRSPPEPAWVSAEFLLEQGVQPFSDLPGWFPDSGDMGKLHRTSVERALNAGLKIAPLRETVRDTLEWHLARPETERTTLRAGISLERERELLALWHSKATHDP
jgi:2'-hydroxyisoflavone reductase